MIQRLHECGGCGHEAQGYTKDELQKQGWVWHVLQEPLSSFILCADCSGAAERRVQDRIARERRARVPRSHCSHCGAATMVLPAPSFVVGTEFRRALPTSLCRDCDKYPVLLRPVAYASGDWAMPDFFFPPRGD